MSVIISEQQINKRKVEKHTLRVGALLGDFDGEDDGLLVGAFVGDLVGADDGLSVGLCEGDKLGLVVGC